MALFSSVLCVPQTHKTPTVKQALPSASAASSRSRPSATLESSDGEEWMEEGKEEKVKTEKMKKKTFVTKTKK